MNSQALYYSTLCVLFLGGALTTGVSVIKSKSLSSPLTNMVSNKDKLFVGGGNYIYVLDKDLNTVQKAVTCEFSTEYCNSNINVNKILLVNKIGDGLVLCGSGNNGSCELRNISNIGAVISKSSTVLYSSKYLKVSTDLSRPAQALISQHGEMVIAITFGNSLETTSELLSGCSPRVRYSYAISTRYITDFNPVGRIRKVLRLYLPEPSLDEFLIYYKASFQSNWMTYFVTNQQNMIGGQEYVSKLVRICQNDTGYYSYADTVIQCTYHGVDYNLIQDAILITNFNTNVYNTSSIIFVGAFTRGNDPESPSGETVMCVTELKSLDDAIMSAKKDHATTCFDESLTCNARYLPARNNFCVDVANLLKGLVIEEYGRETVDDFYPIRKIYTQDDDALYVMTSHTVIKYSTTNCSEYRTCAETMAGRHPLCGWCVYTERATRQSNCSNATNHWLSSLGNCVSMSVQPLGISVTVSSSPSNMNVSLTVQDMPVAEDGDIYICRFVYGSIILSLSDSEPVTSNTFSCKIPDVPAHTNATIELLVKMQTGATALLSSATFLFYDCGFYMRCVDCVSTRGSNCQWCSKSVTCQEPNTCLMQSISNQTNCPNLLDNRGQHFIPDRTETIAVFQAANLIIDPDFIYKCFIPATNVTVKADANSSYVSCTLNITKANEQNQEYRIVVKYGPKDGQHAEINDIFLNFVTVYNCTELASDCSHCKALNRTRYSCVWCKTYKCHHSDSNAECKYSICPAPRITKVMPRNGPVEGGTSITIFGSNFGQTISDVNRITIARVPCILSNDVDDYNVSKSQDFETNPPSRLVCTTPSVFDEMKGVITVTVNSTEGDSSISFAYKRIGVSSIHPDFGPVSGGTMITLYGDNLGVGNRQVTVLLGPRICLQPIVHPILPLDTYNESVNFTIQCTVGIYMYMFSEGVTNITKVVIRQDRTSALFNVVYRLVPDPTIRSLLPKSGIMSGGTTLTVEGKNLDNAHSSFVIVEYEEESEMENCEIFSSEITICKVPEAPQAVKDSIASQMLTSPTDSCVGCIEVMAALAFDGVRFNFTVTFYRDPVIERLPGDGNTVTLDLNNPRLIVNGKYLNLAATTTDVSITVGVESCVLINLNRETIECVPPATKPQSRMSGVEDPEVNVTIGNIRMTVGYIHYKTDGTANNNTVVLISTLSSVFVALLVVLGFIFACRKYRRIIEKLHYLERTQDEKEMAEVAEESRYTTARIRESAGVYADISEDDMIIPNDEETQETGYYDIPDGYLESRPYLKINETTNDVDAVDTHAVSKETVQQSPESDDTEMYGGNLHNNYLHPT